MRARAGGSTFHFTAHVAVAPGPSAPHLRAHQPMLDRRKVWILGGSPATQQLLINQTRFWGMVPRATVTMREVERWMADGPPDVALLDRANLDGARGARSPGGVAGDRAGDFRRCPSGRRTAGCGLLTKPLKCARLHAQLVNQLAAVSGQAAT